MAELRLMVVMFHPRWNYSIDHILKKSHAWARLSDWHWFLYDARSCEYWRDVILAGSPDANVVVADLAPTGFAGNLPKEQWDWLQSVRPT